MALITSDTRCPICNEKLDRPFTATSGCVFSPEHPLWGYCDAPLHFDCLESWVHRVEFSEAYFNAVVQYHESGNGGHLLKKDVNWILATGPCVINSLPYYVEVRFREWPFRLYSRWQEWDKFISSEFRNGIIGNALQLAEQTMDTIIQIAPDLSALTRLLQEKRV